MNKTHRSKFSLHVILWASALFFVIATVWSKFAILDIVTTGDGKVIPSSQIQIIQSLDGGILEKMNVDEGQIVKKGEELLVIDDTRFLAKYNEDVKKVDTLKIQVLRLIAEINNKPFVIPADLQKKYPDMVASETDLFNSYNQQIQQLQEAITLAQKELTLTEPLVSKGAASDVEVLRLKRSINELESKISQFKSETLEKLNKARSDLQEVQETTIADEDKVVHAVIKSPVYGIIQKINTNTLGGVIQPGMDIMEIVPLNDTLLIEAKIKPADIGFIRIGQKALVKITAYDYSIYGGLEGKVERISADTLTDKNDPKQDSYYLIQVRTDKNFLGTKEHPLEIIPGMQASVNVLTGKKSVLDYLLKPIIKAKNAALRER